MRLTLLGTGTSHGVPVLGCICPTCRSSDPKDFRTRSSAYLVVDQVHILIDTATELRLQSLKHGVNRVDLVLITHNHADHISGFDDLRRFNELQQGAIPVYGSKDCLQGIRAMYSYIFNDTVQVGGGKPQIELNPITQPFVAQGVKITPIPVYHGKMLILGYRIGDFAYITDCSLIPEESMKLLQNLELLILGVLRFKPHPTHMNLEAGLALIKELQPRRCFLTHIAHDFRHTEINPMLPEGVALGFDGLQIKL